MEKVVRDELTTSTPDSIPKHPKITNKINKSTTLTTCLDCSKELSKPEAKRCRKCNVEDNKIFRKRIKNE